MKHRTSRRFWDCYHRLPEETRRLADESYRLPLRDPKHPSLHFKRIGRFWSARVGLNYRGPAVEHEDCVARFWVGPKRIRPAAWRRVTANAVNA
jgi:hypothetical protein